MLALLPDLRFEYGWRSALSGNSVKDSGKTKFSNPEKAQQATAIGTLFWQTL